MKRLFKISLLVLLASISLTACNKAAVKNEKGEKPKSEKKVGVQDNLVIENEGTVVKDAALKIAFISNSPFTGIFHPAFADGNPDMEIMGFGMSGTFKADPEYKLIKGGGADIDFKPEEKKVIITINEKYTWNDGVPVTSKDFLEYYKIISDKDYEGVRFDENMRNLEGIEEYHEGKSKEISGFKIINDKKFELIFKKFKPSIFWGGGIAYEPVPSHVFSKIPVKEQVASDATRKHPLSPGPYYIKEIVPGQQVIFEANPYYYKGEAKVKKVIWKLIPSEQIIAALQAGEYDLTVGLNSDLYEKVKALKNVKIAVKDELSYTYLGFKLGTWDKEAKEVKPNPNAKMADKALRQAMGYAIDNDAVGERFYQGLRRNATQLMIPAFKSYYDPNIKGYSYDMEKAKKLLDDAGYKDVDGDGIREDKNGKPLVIKFASMSGGATAEPIAAYYVQQWKELGLNVEYTTGRLIEFNSFYDKLKADDPEIDIYQAAWGTGSNPDPTGLYSRKAAFNFTRFATPELDEIFKKINSDKSLDNDFRSKAYKEFTNYMFENAPVIPTLFRKGITAVNNRVKKYDIRQGSDFGNNDIELLAENPIK